MITSFTQFSYRLDNLHAEDERLKYQSSTKLKIDNGSDDSLVFTQQIYLDDRIAVFNGLKDQMIKTEAQNNTADSSLSEMKNLITTVKSEVVRALNDTSDVESRKSIATNLEGIKRNLLMFANENSNGEYLFAGSDGGVRPFVEDETTGRITYVGNGYLKRVAVDEGSYRDRGVTGFEMMMNTTSSATVGNKLTFSANERVVDGDGNEWVLNPAVPELTKHDQFGATSETKALTEVLPATSPKTYETTAAISTPGEVLHAKESIFDVLDNLINALNQVDSTGTPITKDEADSTLRDGLNHINNSFDSMNAAHNQLGVRNKIFEISLEKVNSQITHFNKLWETTSGVDLGKVAMETKALEMTYTALYSTINRLNGLSLVNYIN